MVKGVHYSFKNCLGLSSCFILKHSLTKKGKKTQNPKNNFSISYFGTVMVE